jgi:hypothetical protein
MATPRTPIKAFVIVVITFLVLMVLLGTATGGFKVLLGILALFNLFVFISLIIRTVHWWWIRHSVTPGQARTQIAMEQAFRSVPRQAPPQASSPATPPSLSARLAALDEAMQAGHLTQEEYATARAAIIASP